jgi:hypothetical protein
MDNGNLLDSDIFVCATETGTRKLICTGENPSTAGVEHNKAAAATAATAATLIEIDRIFRFILDECLHDNSTLLSRKFLLPFSD